MKLYCWHDWTAQDRIDNKPGIRFCYRCNSEYIRRPGEVVRPTSGPRVVIMVTEDEIIKAECDLDIEFKNHMAREGILKSK